MDASKITELLQKQNTRYINRSNTVDASTMTWMNQIQSSKYIKGVATCTGLQNTDVPTQAVCPNGDGTFSFGGGGKGTTLATGSSQHVLSVYSGAAGSASEVYSSDKILLQKAGQNYCAELITQQDPYTILPTCFATSTNGPTSDNPNPTVNNQDTNPYLPPFDTYYKFKNPQSSALDQNQKHYVQYCNGCVIEPVVTQYGWPLLLIGTSGSVIISNSLAYTSDSVLVTGTFKGTINVYDGNATHTTTTFPTITLTSLSPSTLDAFIIKYDQSGKILWFTTIQTVSGTQTTGYSVAVDSSSIYVSGYMDGTINCYHGLARDMGQVYGPVVSSFTTETAALYVVAYSLTGYLRWSTLIDGILPQAAYDPATAPEIPPTNMSQLCTDGNNLYVCQSINPNPAVAHVTVYHSDGVNALILTNGGNGNSQQGFLVQYNARTGIVNWGTRLTGSIVSTYPGSSSATGLICDSGNVYMTGYYNNTANVYDAVTPAAPTFGATRYTVSNGEDNGMYIAAYNKAGVVQWINVGNITNHSFVPIGLQLTMDATGVYALVQFPGGTDGIISFNTTPGGGSFLQLTNVVAPGSYNIGIAKYSLTGSLIWINKILNVNNATSVTDGYSLSSDGSSLYVTGCFGASAIRLYNASTGGDPTPQVASLSTAGDTDTNVFLIKYNLLGALQWSTIIGKAGSYAYGYDVASNMYNIYVTGAAIGAVDLYNANGLSAPTKSGVSLAPTAGAYIYTYVAKYDYNGKVVLG